MARNAIKLARWLHHHLGALVTIENPASSYLWQFLEPLFSNALPTFDGHVAAPDDSYTDVLSDQCRFGTAYKKRTTWRTLGGRRKSSQRSAAW